MNKNEEKSYVNMLKVNNFVFGMFDGFYGGRDKYFIIVFQLILIFALFFF